ncbi:MAG: hypothetical protein AAB215_08235 [Planctomycetota bacterium]
MKPPAAPEASAPPLAHPGPAWRAAEAAGYDMSLVEGALRLTPIERIRANDRALRMAVSLQKAMEKPSVKLQLLVLYAIRERRGPA